MAPTTILDKCSDSDLKRFALCFLYCDRGAIDWNAASALYDPKVKVESFKTVTNRALKKILASEDGGDGNDEPSSVPATPKTKKGRATAVKKRKPATDDEGEGTPPAGKKKGRATAGKGKAKKIKAEPESEQEEGEGEGGKSDEEMEDKSGVMAGDADAEDGEGLVDEV